MTVVRDDGQVAGRPRGFETAGDMIRSLAVIGLVLAALLLLAPRRHYDAVKVVDYGAELAGARRDAPYSLLAPVGLSERWRATSVRYEKHDGATTWHLGFVTPADDYAGVEQSDGDARGFVYNQSNRGLADGVADIGGRRWQRYYRESRDLRTLARTADGATVVVTGDASYDELGRLAAALRG